MNITGWQKIKQPPTYLKLFRESMSNEYSSSTCKVVPRDYGINERSELVVLAIVYIQKRIEWWNSNLTTRVRTKIPISQQEQGQFLEMIIS